MRSLHQIIVITALNLRSLTSRAASSLVVIVGVAGVVAVLISILAMANGLIKAIGGAGDPDRAIVLRQGAGTETSSSLSTAMALRIMYAPGVKVDERGRPIASAELVSAVTLSRMNGADVNVPIRGIGTNAMALRPELSIIDGRSFEPGLYELIVGQALAREYPELAVGSEVLLRGVSWQVVGSFETGGDIHESELMADIDVVQSALRRSGALQSVTVRLTSRAAFDELQLALEQDPTLAVDVLREDEYFARQSRQINAVLSAIAYVIGSIMALGAIFAALNTMYSAVSARTVEIATLRALGFGPAPVVSSVIAEAMLLSLLGGSLGALIAWVLFNGHTVGSTAASFNQEIRFFSLYISPALIAVGIGWALAIGFIGGIFPAIRAARLPVASALREH